MTEFKGLVAVITGANNGFGKEFVKQAAQRGMKIAQEMGIKAASGTGNVK